MDFKTHTGGEAFFNYYLEYFFLISVVKKKKALKSHKPPTLEQIFTPKPFLILK